MQPILKERGGGMRCLRYWRISVGWDKSIALEHLTEGFGYIDLEIGVSVRFLFGVLGFRFEMSYTWGMPKPALRVLRIASSLHIMLQYVAAGRVA